MNGNGVLQLSLGNNDCGGWCGSHDALMLLGSSRWAIRGIHRVSFWLGNDCDWRDQRIDRHSETKSSPPLKIHFCAHAVACLPKDTAKSLALSTKKIPMTPKKVCTAAPRQTSTSRVGTDTSILACLNEICRADKEQIQVQQTISHLVR